MAARRAWSSTAVLVVTLCVTTFTISCTASGLAPFLLDIARDLGTDLAAVANLAAILTVTWSGLSMFAGALSDRIGRRPVLIGALLLMGTAGLGFSQAQSYLQAAAWQLLAGVGGGSYMGTVFATVSDRVEPARRGRALGWVITGQSLAFVLGVPLLTLVGAIGGWRLALATAGITALAASAVIALVVPGGAPVRSGGETRRLPLRRVLDRQVLTLLAASGMQRGCYVGMSIYLATYLLTAYELALGDLALPLMCVALGNLVGNNLGSHLTDRFGAGARMFAASAAATGLLGLPLFLWQPGLAASVALGFTYASTEAIGRPAMLTMLSRVPAEVRGLVLGLNVTANGFGWVSATVFGGWLVVTVGFGGLAIYLVSVGLLGALLGLAAAAAPASLPERSTR